MDSCGNDPFGIGDWTVEPSLDRLSRGETQVPLDPKAMSVLSHLAARAGEVVSGDALIASVWHGRPMSDNGVYQCIARLRKALGDDPHAPIYIETIPKKGYRLIAPVAAVAPPDAPPPAQRRGSRPYLPAALGVFAMLVAIAGITLDRADRPRNDPGQAGIRTLAVLPFSRSGQHPADGISGHAVAEEITNRLSKASPLRVIAYRSASRFSDRNLDVAAAARQLKADYLLVGDLLPQGAGIRIEARLLDASGAELLKFDDSPQQAADTLLTAPGELAQQVADRLGIHLDPELAVSCGGTQHLEACRLWLMAQEHLRSQGPEYKTKAIRLLQRALEQDPGYAMAHAGLGAAYLQPSDEIPWPEAKRRADLAIRRALDLNAALAEAIAARGLARMVDPRGPCPPECFNLEGFKAAEADLRRAVELEPGLVDARNRLAWALAGQGRVREAIEQWETALLFDPMNLATINNLAWYTALQGDAGGARSQLKQSLQHAHVPPYVYGTLAGVEEEYGNLDKALRYRRRLLAEVPSSYTAYVTAWVAWDATNLGRFDDAEKLLAENETAPLADEIYPAARQHLLMAQGRMAELEAYGESLVERANDTYARRSEWPRWLLKQLGQGQAVLGHHDQAARYLKQVYADPRAPVDHARLASELDSMHFLGHSLRRLGRTGEADAVLEQSLALIRHSEAQGASFPDLTLAEARAHALQGNTALAVATLRQAVAQGWRGYWSMPSDPRWDSLRPDPEFKEILAKVRDDVEVMAERTPAYVALTTR